MSENEKPDSKEVNMEDDRVCLSVKAPFSPPSKNEKIGVSVSFFSDESTIIHGLRHPREEGVSGWYLWKGEYSDDKNFFQPMHLEHLLEATPELMPYLALPPGWRFLVDTNNGYEDVWRDLSLIEIE